MITEVQRNQITAKQRHRIRAAEIDSELDNAARCVPPELAKRATSARPGEYRKVVILAARYRYGLPLQHPHDQEGAIYCDERPSKYTIA